MGKMLITVAASAFSLTALFAKDVVWTGNGSGGWGDPDNWSEAPEADDVAVLPANTLVPVVAADRAAFLAFGGYRLEPGSTLFLDAVTFASTSAFSKPLSGSGALVAVGGSMYLTADNSDFDGTFAFTNNYCEVHSKTGLGTTNSVWVRGTGLQQEKILKIARVDGPNVMSNAFYFASNGDTIRTPVFQAVKTPLVVEGPVTIVRGWCQFFTDTASTAYRTAFRGGIGGDGFMICGHQKDLAMDLESEVDISGSLVAFDGGFVVYSRIRRGRIGLESKNKGYKFMAAGLCCTNDVFVGECQITHEGGYLDLNGFSQTIGNVCERIDHNGVATETNFYFTSESPATITIMGTPNRRFDPNGFAGCLKGAVSLCYDWDGRAGPTAYLTGCTAGIFRLTGDNSTTTGGIHCRRGTFKIESTAALPNLTSLSVSDTGKMTVSADGIGAGGAGLLVQVAGGTGALTISANVTLGAKRAFVDGRWLDAGTYGGNDSSAPNKLAGLAGTGVMTVAEYGGPKGFSIIFR